MKVAYVTTYDSTDVQAYSGTGLFMYQALQRSGFEIVRIGNLRDTLLWYRPKRLIYRMLLSQNYHRNREPILLRSYARQVSAALAQIEADVVFSPGTLPIAYLDTSIPIIFWTDATFAGMVDFYPGYFNLCRETLKHGHLMDQQALSRCRLAIYSSDWAAKSAVENYDVDPRKVMVVPYGANLDISHNDKDVEGFVKTRDAHKCKLLFVGKDWYRKGGDVALKVAQWLNDNGWKTELHVVGCNPPVSVPSYVILHGFISKNTQVGRDQLNRLFAQSHFFILPSKAECVAVVFAEASAFGLPSLATDVGGIPTAIRNGVNGQLFQPEAHAQEYGEFIAKVLSQPGDYKRLAMSSYKEFCDRLNWTAAGAAVSKLVRESCL